MRLKLFFQDAREELEKTLTNFSVQVVTHSYLAHPRFNSFIVLA